MPPINDRIHGAMRRLAKAILSYIIIFLTLDYQLSDVMDAAVAQHGYQFHAALRDKAAFSQPVNVLVAVVHFLRMHAMWEREEHVQAR